MVLPARCPGRTPGFGSVRNLPQRATRARRAARRAARRSPGGAGAGPSGRGEARAEHVTTARGAGRAVPRGGSGGESNGGRGRLRAGRAAGAAAAEARRAGTFPGRASSVITPSTVAPGETAGERPSVAGTDNGQLVASSSGRAPARLRPCPGRGLGKLAEVLERRPHSRRGPCPQDLCGACAPVGPHEEPADGLHPGNLPRAWDPLSLVPLPAPCPVFESPARSRTSAARSRVADPLSRVPWLHCFV